MYGCIHLLNRELSDTNNIYVTLKTLYRSKIPLRLINLKRAK